MEPFNDKDNDDRSEEVGIRGMWVIVGETGNRTLADFAINGLKSYEIPAVLKSKGGFFGSIGLPLRSLKTGKLDLFEILVPAEFEEEAKGLVKIFLGDDSVSDVSNELEEDDE